MISRMTSDFKMETTTDKEEREEEQNCQQTFGSLASAKTILAPGSTFISKKPTVDAGLTAYPKTTRLLDSQDEWDDDPSFDLDSAYDPDYEDYYYEHESNTDTVYEIQYYHSDSDTDSEFTTVIHQNGATTVQLDTFTSDTDSDTDSFPMGLNTVVQQNSRTNDRITEMQQEHLATQKKIFTKWVNSYLQKESMKVDNLFEDFKDGKKLIVLLEILTGDKLPKPSRGTMRVHSIENVNIALNFMQSRFQMRLQLIGAEDIVDGNPNLISGLVWLLIQTFQIESVLSSETTQLIEDETTKILCAKETLLKWCQEQTKTYEGVDIKNFNHVNKTNPDENLIIMYVASLYHALKKTSDEKNRNVDSQHNGEEDWRQDTPHSYRVQKLTTSEIIPCSPTTDIVPSRFPSSLTTDIVPSPFPSSPTTDIVPSSFPSSPTTDIVPSSFPCPPSTDIVPSSFPCTPSTEIVLSPFPSSPITDIVSSSFPCPPSTDIVPSSFPCPPSTEIVPSPSPASPSAEIVLAQLDSTNTPAMCLIKGSPPNSKNSPYTVVKRSRPAVSRSLPSRGTAALLWPHCPSTPGGQPSGRGIAPRRTVLGASEALSHQRADWVTPVASCVIGIILVGHVFIALYSTLVSLLVGLIE